MHDLVRKSILLGMGVFQITREKVEKFVGELQADGKLTPEEGKRLVEEVLNKAEKEGGRLSKEVEKSVKKAIKDLNIEETLQSIRQEQQAKSTPDSAKTVSKKPVTKSNSRSKKATTVKKAKPTKAKKD